MTEWYPAKKVKGGPEGFTSDPEYAQTARVNGQDLPILCRGGVMQLVQKTNMASLKIWEKLLDAMEQNFEFIEQYNAKPEFGKPHVDVIELETKIKQNAGVRAGLVAALCLLTYGSDDENAVKLIQAQAKIRYNQSVE